MLFGERGLYMKKFFLLLLFLFVLVVFSACDKNIDLFFADKSLEKPSSLMESSNFSQVYPLNTSESVYSTYDNIPEILFSTTGSENGLGGTIYSFKGRMLGSYEEYGDLCFVVETKYGKVLITNVYYEIKDEIPALQEECCIIPEIDEYARFCCIYEGFSEVAQMPAFIYGNDAFLLSAYFDSDEETEESIVNDSEPETVVFEGKGDKVITDITLDDGRYKVHITYKGAGVFSVFGYDADDDLIFVESSYGACDKYELLRQAKFPLILDISADNAWKIEFEKID